MDRAVGYCMHVGDVENEGCDDYAKGVFLLNHGGDFLCPRCLKIGLVVVEKGRRVRRGQEPFKEVRVEFNYIASEKRYREVAIIRDESIQCDGSSYTLTSPLIKTERRALKVGETILANLQHESAGAGTDEIPRGAEVTLSFDEPFVLFKAKVDALQQGWRNSSLVAAREVKHKYNDVPGLPPVFEKEV